MPLNNKDTNIELIHAAMELMAERLRSREPIYKDWPIELIIFSFLMRAELKANEEKSN